MTGTAADRIRVLHVDDEPEFVDLAATFLERESDCFEVETATSADDGLAVLAERPPDCIVSDYDMPGMNGIEFLDAVRETHPELPFVLFTGRGSEQVASDAIAADVTDYLEKGSGSEQYELLANRIQNAVRARRDAQAAARQEELMRLTEFAGGTGGWELDVEDETLRLTDGTRRLVGLPDGADLSLDDAIELYHPDDREEIRETLDRVAETGEQAHGTWRLQPPDGGERILDVTVTAAATNGDGTTLRGAINDVTEQKRRNRELRSERTFVQQALDTLEDLFYVVGVDGSVQRWNDRLPEVTGYPESELAGMDAVELFPADDRATIADAVESALSGGEPTVEADLLTADGRRVPYEFTGAQLTDPDGETTGLVGIGRDLSERRQRERRFQALVEESNDVVSVVDTDGRYQYQSPSLERILGHDPAETVGDSVWEYIHPDDREMLENTFESWVADPDTTGPVEYRARHADGSWRWMEARGNNQLDNPAIGGYVVNSRDVTEQKERKRQLTELNKTVKKLLAADTQQEVADVGVAAARDVLGLPANGIHLSETDDGETQLVPVAHTDEAAALLGELPSLPVADSIAGRVYQDGEPAVVEDVRQEAGVHNPATDLGGHLYLPLADHGVLIASSDEPAAFDRQDLLLGELLAENIVAALDRLERERTAHRRQQQLSLFFEESPIGAVQWDENFRFERVNERAEEILGYTEAELRGESWQMIVAENDRDRVGDAAEQLLAVDGGTHVVNENRRKDGETRTCTWHNRAVTDADGTVQSIFSKFRDVTEQRERQRKLEQTRDLMANMETLADVGAWEYDPASETLVMTDGAYRLYGLDPDASLTLEEAFEHFEPDDREVLRDRFDRCLETGEPYEEDVRLTTAGGTQRWITARGEWVDTDESGGVVRGYVQDSTDQREREAERAKILSRVSDAFFALDDDLRFTHVNSRAEELLDASEADLLGETLWETYSGTAESDRIRDAVDAAIATQDTQSLSLYHEPLELWVEVTVYPSESGVSVYLRDVTEHREHEQELERQNERLEEFASIVSHDLRSPLTVAEGHLELAQETCESDHLARVADAIERSQALIDDLLTLARGERDASETEPVALADVAERSWQTAETGAATLEVDATRTIQADSSRLRQLFENLYRNSVEHGSTSSRPEADDTVEHGSTSPHSRAREDSVEHGSTSSRPAADDVTVRVGETDDGFYVADTGSGIPDAERERVFDAGYSTADDGTGFGLRIVEQVAGAHGWAVAVTDSKEGGARFEFTW